MSLKTWDPLLVSKDADTEIISAALNNMDTQR